MSQTGIKYIKPVIIRADKLCKENGGKQKLA
jgi:hypothetical protein